MKRKLLLLASFFILFAGTNVKAQIVFLVESPSNLVGSYEITHVDDDGASGGSPNWGVDMDTYPSVTDTLVLISDGTSADSLGCQAAVNGAQINGNIAVVYRRDCEFGLKAKNAQDAGARAVVIINWVDGEGPVGMGPGTYGAQVTIPVVMISKEDGALLRSAIDAGQLIAFIGNKTGLYPNDLGTAKKDIIVPGGFAIPKDFARDSTDFKIPVGAWVVNFGSDTQTNATVSAQIKLGANTVYSNTAIVDTMMPGDTMFFSLPAFAKASYDTGYYTLTYTVSADSADQYPADNMFSTSFWINEYTYSKSSWTDSPREPVATSFYRPQPNAPTDPPVAEFRSCIILKEENANRLKIHGMSFAATTTATFPIADQSVILEFYKLDDVHFQPIDSIGQPLAEKVFTFPDESFKEQFVKVKFDSPITLQDNQKYLTCVRVVNVDSLRVGYDVGIDYESTLYGNPRDTNAFFPVQVVEGNSNTWYPIGFGTNSVPAIILYTSDQPFVGVKEEQQMAKHNITPYPNPATTYITIPLKETYNGKISLQVFDMAGKLVKSETVNMAGTNLLNVPTDLMGNGTYIFNLKFEDRTESSFSVVIAQ